MRGFVHIKVASICFVIILIGCASGNIHQTEMVRQAGEHRQLMDRQRASADEAALGKVPPPLTAEGYEKLGDHYCLQGKTDIAFKNYSEAIRMEPRQVRIRHKIGRLFLEKGLWEDAEKEFRGILEKSPDYAPAHEGLGRILLGRNKPGDAEAALEMAIRLDPSLWQAHNLLGMMYDRKKEFAKASLHYQEAMTLQPNIAILHNNLGMSLFLRGEYDASLQALVKGAILDPHNKKIINNLALLLCKTGKIQDAFERFKRVGSEASAHYNIGSFYLFEKRYQEAISSYQRAIDARPEFYVEAHEAMNRAKAALATSPL
ncbi:MAG: tetratricopeptide repeat protein [Deltaproteobacteria bacterium]|nr:tetratricopeptide repeat protein [Deltaproteobacteria bacterium]